MKQSAPSHLSPKYTGRRPLLPRLLVGTLALCAAGALSFFLWFVLSFSTETTAEGTEVAETSAQDASSGLDDALASSQAEMLARAATEQVPSVLDELDWVTVDLIPVNEYSRPGDLLEDVNAIVVHYTGNPGTTAEQHRSYYAGLAETGEASVSSHFVIGMDGTIIQCIPLDEKSYCSNDRNGDTISIECCHPDSTGEFTEETQDALVNLLQYLTDAYGLGYDEVIRHYEVTGKLCPYYYVENPDAWEALKARVFED